MAATSQRHTRKRKEFLRQYEPGVTLKEMRARVGTIGRLHKYDQQCFPKVPRPYVLAIREAKEKPGVHSLLLIHREPRLTSRYGHQLHNGSKVYPERLLNT